ncbi:MAG: hypothetical protein ABIK44_02095 [candidate division WOR-3 bacterium]
MRRWLGLVGILAMLCGKTGKNSMAGTNPEHGTMNYWHDVKFIPDPSDSTGKRGRWAGWFHQDNVDVSRLGQGEIRARVEGRWQSFKVVELPVDFCQWNFGRRLKQLGSMVQMMERGEMPDLSGPHNGMVASHGARRKDSDFSINCAVKGMGWLPRPEKLPELIELLKATWDDTITRKLSVLESLYRNGSQIFDLTKQTSLELYAQPNFETHTFLNQMADPGVAIVFLDLPKSYELRCIAQMLHPDDPGLSEYEKQVVEYVNLIHDYFHGQSPRRSIAVIYHLLQVFDNSPGRWRGQRIAPPVAR